MRISTATAATVLSLGALLGTGAAPASAAPNDCAMIFCTPEAKVDQLSPDVSTLDTAVDRLSNDRQALRREIAEAREDAQRANHRLQNSDNN